MTACGHLSQTLDGLDGARKENGGRGMEEPRASIPLDYRFLHLSFYRYKRKRKGDAEKMEAVVRGTKNNHVSSAADIHSYRADYATRVYLSAARDISGLKGEKIDYTELTGKVSKNGSRIYKSAVYYCRGDQKGLALDRAAMIIASQNLGHNRESVVGEHYLRLSK